MKTIIFTGNFNFRGFPLLKDRESNLYLLYQGIPHHISENGKPLSKVSEYMLILDSFENEKGSTIIAYTNSQDPYAIHILDNTLNVELTYIIGKYQYLSKDGMEEGIPKMIESFEQVISAWKNNEIFFNGN